MKALFVVLFLVIAGLSFYGGYELGTSSKSPKATSEPQPVEIPEPEIPDPVEPDAAQNVPPPLPELPEEEPLAVPEDSGLAARAALRYVTLIDREGRDLVGEVLESGEESLRVRRRVDFRVVDIPIDLLSNEDRIFAEFLRKSGETETSSEQETASAPIERGPDITERDLVERIRDEFSGSRFQ